MAANRAPGPADAGRPVRLLPGRQPRLLEQALPGAPGDRRLDARAAGGGGVRTMARLTRDTAEDVVVNRAGGRMLTPTATELRVRELEPMLSDEPPVRGGENRGPSPLELVLCSLCACTNVSTTRMAAKLRFDYTALETEAEGELD